MLSLFLAPHSCWDQSRARAKVLLGEEKLAVTGAISRANVDLSRFQSFVCLSCRHVSACTTTCRPQKRCQQTPKPVRGKQGAAHSFHHSRRYRENGIRTNLREQSVRVRACVRACVRGIHTTGPEERRTCTTADQPAVLAQTALLLLRAPWAKVMGKKGALRSSSDDAARLPRPLPAAPAVLCTRGRLLPRRCRNRIKNTKRGACVGGKSDVRASCVMETGRGLGEEGQEKEKEKHGTHRKKT